MISTRNCISRSCSSTFRWHERVNFLLGCPISGSLTSLLPWPDCKTFPVVYVALTQLSCCRRGNCTAITSSDPYSSCSRTGFHSVDLLSLLGVDGLHTHRGDCCGYRVDPYLSACTLFNLV